MEKIIYENTKVPIKLWLNDIEEGALQQANNVANLPFVYKHVAIMPDAHQGYGVSIGTVLATEGVVIPNATGVDIGCGIIACKTSLKTEQLDKETLKKIMGKIREVIPVGKEHQKDKQSHNYILDLNQFKDRFGKNKSIIELEYNSALKQLGTLGGGNHFLEIQKDKENNIWIMIHSGSRNLGYRVAKYYNELAIKLNEQWFSRVPKEWELAFLPIQTQEAKDYMSEMQYCVNFALANRKLMMERIIRGFSDVLNLNIINKEPYLCNTPYDKTINKYTAIKEFRCESFINIAHNYAQWENHCGRNVIVHRKGATLAREGTIGIIPGSMGSKSYIVEGLGNPDSFMSCSHGAGRALGRKEAIRTLNLDKEKQKLDEQGIIHGIRTQQDLEEATSAYKNILEVMENQKDLVKILVELQPLAVIKG